MRGPDHSSAECLTDRLMTQADTENRHLATELLDDAQRHAGVSGCAGSGRDNDSIRRHFFDLIERDFVVAADFDTLPQLAEILREVVRKRVVVVDDQKHRAKSEGQTAGTLTSLCHCRKAVYFSQGETLACLIRTGTTGFSSSLSARLIASATSIPRSTRPNAANFPSRWRPSPTKIKKCVVALLGSSPRAIETIPRTCLTSFGSSGSARCIRVASSAPQCSLVERFPPWITKPLTMRLKVVVSSAPEAARFIKFLTVCGAFAGSISITIAPCSVSSVTHWPDICPSVALLNASTFVAGEGEAAGRAFTFFKLSELGCGFWAPTSRIASKTQ